MLSEQTIQVVKATVPVIEGASEVLTDHFYKRLFLHNPELQDVFNMSHQRSGKQRAALYDAIAAYAKNIDNLVVLSTAVERIAHKHSSFAIQPEHYDIVGLHLIETLRELLGKDFTPEIENAWVEAYGFLASIFIGREEEIYSGAQSQFGGWRGERRFVLSEKRIESSLVTSFVFRPADGQPVLPYQPGQYLGIKVKPSTAENIEIRQYSLSTCSNGQSYQISVKREGTEHPGVVSHYLHNELQPGDTVEIMPPCGDFYYQERQAPTVLLSAGVGLTPMQAMLESLYKQRSSQPLLYLHACNHPKEHSFAETLKEIMASDHARASAWQSHVWYAEGGSSSHENNPVDQRSGFMQLPPLQDSLHLKQAHFYMCGPVAFMAAIKGQLLELGVDNDRVHYEVFGPHESL